MGVSVGLAAGVAVGANVGTGVGLEVGVAVLTAGISDELKKSAEFILLIVSVSRDGVSG